MACKQSSDIPICLGITAEMWTEVQSDCVEFGHNEDSYRLVKWRANTEALFIRAPVKTGNGLCGESDVLQEIHRASDAHVYIVSTLFSPLGWILTVTIHKQWSIKKGTVRILTKRSSDVTNIISKKSLTISIDADYRLHRLSWRCHGFEANASLAIL